MHTYVLVRTPSPYKEKLEKSGRTAEFAEALAGSVSRTVFEISMLLWDLEFCGVKEAECYGLFSGANEVQRKWLGHSEPTC